MTALLFALTVTAALGALFLALDARKAARRAMTAAAVAEDAAAFARAAQAVANKAAFDRLGVRR